MRLARKNPITIPSPPHPEQEPDQRVGVPLQGQSSGGRRVMGVKFSMPYTNTSTSPMA